MKHIASTIFVLCCALVLGAQQTDAGEFWMPMEVHWKHPRGAPRDETVAATVILYYGKNGVFARDECWVNRKGRSITISNGDPHNEFIGRWEPIADGMHMTYRLVRRTVEKKDDRLPGEEMHADAEMPKSGLSVNDQLFRRITPTNAAEYISRYEALANNDVDTQDQNPAR